MNQPEEIKLLPCPFCGCQPIPFDTDIRLVHTPSCYLEKEHSWVVGDRKVKVWNTRTPNEATKELLEDKARLDWCDKHPFLFVDLDAENWLGIECEEAEIILCKWAGNINDRYKVFLGSGKTFRTAISNAMKQEKS